MSEFLRIVPEGTEALLLKGAERVENVRRLASCIAELLEMLSREAGGRPKMLAFAGELRKEFQAAGQRAETLTIQIDDINMRDGGQGDPSPRF